MSIGGKYATAYSPGSTRKFITNIANKPGNNIYTVRNVKGIRKSKLFKIVENTINMNELEKSINERLKSYPTYFEDYAKYFKNKNMKTGQDYQRKKDIVLKQRQQYIQQETEKNKTYKKLMQIKNNNTHERLTYKNAQTKNIKKRKEKALIPYLEKHYPFPILTNKNKNAIKHLKLYDKYANTYKLSYKLNSIYKAIERELTVLTKIMRGKYKINTDIYWEEYMNIKGKYIHISDNIDYTTHFQHQPLCIELHKWLLSIEEKINEMLNLPKKTKINSEYATEYPAEIASPYGVLAEFIKRDLRCNKYKLKV